MTMQKCYSLLLFWPVDLKNISSPSKGIWLVLLVSDLDDMRNCCTWLAGTPIFPSVTYSAVVTFSYLYSQSVVPHILSMLFISQLHESE